MDTYLQIQRDFISAKLRDGVPSTDSFLPARVKSMVDVFLEINDVSIENGNVMTEEAFAKLWEDAFAKDDGYTELVYTLKREGMII